MTGEPDLVSLLYRADWTQLSLSAEVSDGSRLLIAPGRRYRLQTPDHLTGCDGDRPWKLPPRDQDDGAGGTVHWISGPRPPLPLLLCPAWLLTESRLDVTGLVSACGRDALHVVATAKPGLEDGRGPRRFPGDRAEAVVDAELGIVLRLSWTTSAGPPGSEPSGPAEVLELVSLELSPVIDPAQFAPPPGSLIAESLRESLGGGGLAWQAVKTAGGLAAGGLGAWIRYSPSGHRRPGTSDMAAGIPADGPAPELSADGRPSGPPVSADVLHLLHAGRPGRVRGHAAPIGGLRGHAGADPGGCPPVWLRRPRPAGRHHRRTTLGIPAGLGPAHRGSGPVPDRPPPRAGARPGDDRLRRAATVGGLPRPGDRGSG